MGRPRALDDKAMLIVKQKLPSTSDSEATDESNTLDSITLSEYEIFLIEQVKLDIRKRRCCGVVSYLVANDFLCNKTLRSIKRKLLTSL